MAVRRSTRWGLFIGVILLLAALPLLQSGSPDEPLVVLHGPDTVEFTLRQLRSLPAMEREGSYQNRYGNWSAGAVYRGVPLATLVERCFPHRWPSDVRVVAADGYQLTLTADRLEDPAFPVVLAYAKDGVEPPAWEEGPQIALLPEKGRVSNEDYDAESAGAYWVRNVVRLELEA